MTNFYSFGNKLASLEATLVQNSADQLTNINLKLHHSPVDYVEDEEYNGEDDEEGDVDEGVVVLLPLAASQLPELHIHQDGSVPAQQTVVQSTFIFKNIDRLESCCGS